MQIGDVSVVRIAEAEGPRSKPEILFPDFDRESFDQHLTWLVNGHYLPDENRLMMSFHSWLVRTPEFTVLVDTCAGNHKDRPNNPSFHQLKTPWLEHLAAEGVRPEDVDVVVCTHLHVDHCGWNTRRLDGRWVPTFPNARYIFSCDELNSVDTRNNPPRSDDINSGAFEDSVLPILLAGQAVPVSGSYAISEHLLLEPAPGHTVGSVTLRIRSKGQNALFTGDIMHHPIQANMPEWNSRYCKLPELARTTRRRILTESADQNTVIFPAHFTAPYYGRAVRTLSGFKFLFGDD